MSDFKLNKINRHLLDMIKMLSVLPENIEEFVQEGDQKSVDVLAKKIDEIDEKWDKAKKSIATLIKVIVDPDTIDDDFEKTEKGVIY